MVTSVPQISTGRGSLTLRIIARLGRIRRRVANCWRKNQPARRISAPQHHRAEGRARAGVLRARLTPTAVTAGTASHRPSRTHRRDANLSAQALDDGGVGPCRHPRTSSGGRSGPLMCARSSLSMVAISLVPGSAEAGARGDGAAVGVDLRHVGWCSFSTPGRPRRTPRSPRCGRSRRCPGRSSPGAFAVAGIGPVSMRTGSTPARAKVWNRARGVRPSGGLVSALMIRAAEAPSQIWELLPRRSPFPQAGTTAGLASPSAVVPGRIPSSVVTMVSSTLISLPHSSCGSLDTTGMISFSRSGPRRSPARPAPGSRHRRRRGPRDRPPRWR